MASQHDIPNELISLAELHLPLYTSTAEAQGIPEAAMTLTQKLIGAKGLVGSQRQSTTATSPVFNNAIAWVSRSGGDDWRAAFAKICCPSNPQWWRQHKSAEFMRLQLEHLGCNCLARNSSCIPRDSIQIPR